MSGIIYHASSVLGMLGADGGVDSTTGATLASALRDFIGPILLIVIGIVAVTFLFKRQLTQFFQFMALAILVALLFYTPNVLPSIAQWIAALFTSDPGTTYTPPS